MGQEGIEGIGERKAKEIMVQNDIYGGYAPQASQRPYFLVLFHL